MPNCVNILAVNDHRLALDSLASTLANYYRSTTVTTYSDLDSLLDDKPMIEMQDLVLIDIRMLPKVWFEPLNALKERSAKPSILAMGAATDRLNLEAALKYGANGFFTPDTPSEELLETVEALLSGQTLAPAELLALSN